MSDDSILAHFGVKGMKWGKRKKPERGASFRKTTATDYKNIKSKAQTPEQKANNLLENKHKFAAKFDEEERKKGWRPTKKQVAYTLLGATLVAGFIYLSIEGKKLAAEEAANVVKLNESKQKLKALLARIKPGDAVSNDDFHSLVSHSIGKSWTGNKYLQDVSYQQKEMLFPKNHKFHRISTGVETDFKLGTYATGNMDDFHRYISAFRKEKGNVPLKHVTFQAKKDIRVPDLVTRLNTMKDTLTDQLGYDKSLGYEAAPSDAKALYTKLSGGSWDDNNAKAFFGKLEARGFNGIIDDMDAGVMGESPLVLFGKDAFTEKSAKTLTQDVIDIAEKTLKEISNRKI